ncbi:MAG: hypothetical protein KME04_20595 [Pleurocapsa minor GSE-CHR-MK-17-07R]|nr:hypothetical protein [Pleurocapsa minor GSE-CHR-MK 17-07R]
MANQKRSVMDEVASKLRRFLNDLERLMNPDAQRPARVPVPIPVRQDYPPRPNQDRYR